MLMQMKIKKFKDADSQKLEEEETKDNDVDQSIESIPIYF